MKISKEELKKLVVDKGYVSERDFENTAIDAKKQGLDVQDALVDRGLILDEHLGKLIADAKGFNFINLRSIHIGEDSLSIIPEPVARNKGVFVFKKDDQGVHVGMVDPTDMETINMISKRMGGVKVIPYLITEMDHISSLSKYKYNQRRKLDEILKELKKNNLTKEQRNQITVETVNVLMKYAYRSEASDIHIEPEENYTLVRFRIDGVMHDILKLPKDLAEYVITRIKILSKLRIDEHQAAQDSKFRIVLDGEKVDNRVSIVPVTKGENVVIRMLATKTKSYSLSSIGMLEEDFETVNRISKIPIGMILITGPTGSGKTTTIYSLMKILNTREVHISTIEDPVEYEVKGASQIPVNTETNLTFAEGLRAIVRQDPDIIGVGEIRDHETANIAVNSAMTGHLVLSTLHANDAPTTVLRLIDMGIKPFLVASTINVVIAQRLVRKICSACRVSREVTPKEREAIEKNLNLHLSSEKKHYKELLGTRLYSGKGCDVCDHTGFKGRIGIFEIMEMMDNIKELVMKQATDDEIKAAAKKNGMTTMFEDGLKKVKLGMTTVDEVLRVITE